MKRGFTLIELLAVIVIMALLLLVFVPNVLKLVDDSETKTYSVKEKIVSKAAEDYVVLNKLSLPSGVGEEVLLNINTLIENKHITKIYDLTKKDQECVGYVSIKKVTGYGYKYKTCLFCENYQTNDNDCDIDKVN